MAFTTAAMMAKYYPSHLHPYRIYEDRVSELLQPSMTLLDAGCGRTAPVLRNYASRVRQCIGVDLEDFGQQTLPPNLRLIRCGLEKIDVPSTSVDLVMSRSVMEHLEHPEAVLREMNRILTPGGRFLFLTPNFWDYASLGARIIPNSLHPWLVERMEGRKQEDTFPTFYRANTIGDIHKLASSTGFTVASARHYGQYPNYLLFNRFAFAAGMAYEKFVGHFESLHFLRSWILAELVKR